MGTIGKDSRSYFEHMNGDQIELVVVDDLQEQPTKIEVIEHTELFDRMSFFNAWCDLTGSYPRSFLAGKEVQS